MRLAVVQRLLGLLMLMFSVTLLPPIAISYYYDDGGANAFLYSFVATIMAGLAIWFPVRHRVEDLRLRDGFLVVAAF